MIILQLNMVLVVIMKIIVIIITVIIILFIYLFVCLFIYPFYLLNDTSNTFSLMIIDTSYDKVTMTRNGLILTGHE